MKKMLVTGASGFLGSKVASYYRKTYEVLTPSHEEMDITEEVSVNSYFKAHKPDVVIHCAAISDIGTCEKKPDLSWRVNVIGSENIAKAANLFSAKCVMCSSDQVYGGSASELAHKEDESLKPINTYGKEKMYAEQSCLKLHEDSVHLRLAWMYDVNDINFIRRNDFLKQMRDILTGEKEYVYVVNDKRGITDVWEVVRNIELAMKLPGGVYNFGAPNGKSTYETAVEILEKMHGDTSIVGKTEYESERNLTMSQEKINSFGIYFTPTIESAIENLKEHNEKYFRCIN